MSGYVGTKVIAEGIRRCGANVTRVCVVAELNKLKNFDTAGLAGSFLFDNPKARDLSRVGVVDVGSNSVRLVVFDGAARSPAYFFNEKVMCALGAGLAESGKLNPDGRLRALSALRRFCTIAKGIGLPSLTAVATAAVREASDGPDFIMQVQSETGLKIHIIDGPEEARLLTIADPKATPQLGPSLTAISPTRLNNTESRS